MARDTPGDGDDHTGLIVALFRGLVAFVTLAYIGLIGILCAHWLRAGETSVLYLGLLPAIMLLLLNIVLWRAHRRPKP